ncbi:MAG TPA: DUF4245 domain-containing protein [Segeticoccus sp.]|uniref:DUF4245 domain-containing protein n=1 Tax=Segeticoccus sp. TaxID=2706531 RepID=UPI002D7E3704|nr:DUF4245 domain-containing protein [Segeticoccus sp.]HET8599217.1 DUF4245 domain-containing protein [Segeticoccus sp.]
MGTARSLLISMIVVLAFVAVWVAFVPRPNGNPPQSVDAMASAKQVRQQQGWDLRMPASLPKGWRATSVRFGPGPDSLQTFHAGYLSRDENSYVGLEETTHATAHWLEVKAGSATHPGTVTVEGEAWQKRTATDEHGVTTHSLVLRGGKGLTVVVAGNGTYADLARFAGRLQPLSASSRASAG